ncbi:MAG TPA: CFI-box-CTERM domain-containing protein [Candidatus Manganitrophaceae bacterium]|nr:CFI-box-CTERM domain-containing protein [Candidatus Manganitrophaceae bacterium]
MRTPHWIYMFGMVLIGFHAQAIFAQTPLVKTGGPIGGLGYDVRISPSDKNTMFVTDNWSGVNKSADAGATWVNSNTGIDIKAGPSNDAVPIFSLTIDPNNANRLWAGTQGEGPDFGVFRSDDGGSVWTKKITGIALGGDIGLVFRGFTVQIGDSNVVYAMAEVPTVIQGKEFNRVKGRIYKTTDAGANWSLIRQGDDLARYLIIHPTDSNILYASAGIFDREAFNSDCAAGTPGGVGVLKSVDGGANWASVNSGLTDLYVGSLRMSPSDPNTLFAATGNNACSGSGAGMTSGLFKTTNGGANWTKVIADDIITTVNFSPSNPTILYAGSAPAFYRSGDGGITWTAYQKSGGTWGPPGIRAGVPIDVIVDPDDPNILYANNYGGGVFKSVDGARNWVSWSRGYTGAELHDIDVSPQNGSVVYAIGRSGPFKSKTGGGAWTGVANGAAAGIPEWYGIRQKPDNIDVLLISDEHQGLVFRSADRGNDFQEVLRHPSADAGAPDKRQGFKALAFSTSNPSVVYAGLAKDRNTIGSSIPLGTVLYKSADGGATWAAVPSSLDGKNVNTIAVHPSDPATAYAATTAGLFKTADGGSVWSALSSLNTRDIRSVVISPSTPETLYAGEENGGVWKSIDGGTTWAGPKVTGFSSPNPSVRGLAVDPANPSLVYAGDWTSGLYRSTDGGETWSGFPDNAMTGLSTKAVKDLALSSDGSVLYVATHGEGVFRYGATDGGAPAVSAATPAADATAVPVNSVITATFNEEIDPLTLTSSTFTVSGGVTGAIGYSGKVAAFTPSAALANGTPYAVTLTTGVTDLAGNPMSANYSWQFTTESGSGGGGGGGGGCLIATAAYGSYLDPHVVALRSFRDRRLLTHSIGRAMISFYNRFSPPVAHFISTHEWLKAPTRWALTPIIYAVIYPTTAMMIVFGSSLILIVAWRKKRSWLWKNISGAEAPRLLKK